MASVSFCVRSRCLPSKVSFDYLVSAAALTTGCHKQIIPVSSNQRVITASAGDGVVARAPIEYVGAAVPRQTVVERVARSVDVRVAGENQMDLPVLQRIRHRTGHGLQGIGSHCGLENRAVAEGRDRAVWILLGGHGTRIRVGRIGGERVVDGARKNGILGVVNSKGGALGARIAPAAAYIDPVLHCGVLEGELARAARA